jgi:hypothetical protein
MSLQEDIMVDYRLEHRPEPLNPEGWVPVFWLRFSKGEAHIEQEFRLDGVAAPSRDEAKEHNREVFRQWLSLHDPEGGYEETE